MKQSGYDQMQLLQQQQQGMLKQLHLLQMQQQNFVNPYSSTVQKQTDRTMFSMGQQHPNHVMYQKPDSLAARPPSGQYDFSPAQLSLQQGPYISNLGVQRNTMSEAGSFHGLNDGIYPNNLLPQQFVTSPSGGQEEQASWSSFRQKDTKLSQGAVPLDPLEEKILFNMDDSNISEIACGMFGDKLDSVNDAKPFPSIRSGSWSALMQTAVAEATSSDTGFPEEFSGLTYQNMELSTDINDTSNFIDSEKQQAGYLNSNSFPGFQVPLDQPRSGVFQDDIIPDSTHMSSSMTGHWVDSSPQPKISRMSFDNVSTSNMYTQPSGMLDQIQSQTGSHYSCTADLSASDLAGMSPLVPSQLRKEGRIPQFVQQNDPATVSVPEMQMISPFVASQPDNATYSGGTNHQFNVWMDLPTHQHSVDQDSLKAPLNLSYSTSPVDILGNDVKTWQNAQHMSSTTYNVPQRVDLPQEQGAAANNTSDTKLPRDSDVSSMSQLNSFMFDDPKMEQNVCSSGKQPGGRSHLNLSASASLWFKQVGDFRNDQMQPTHDYHETPDQLPQYYKPINTMNKQEDIITTKKRKLMRIKLLAWHKEVSKPSQKEYTISGADQKWATAANMLVEKAEYDTQNSEFALPLHRSKRRLVLTTHLMQQLFDPPPSFVLFSAASLSYHKLLFFVGRVTIGDACSLTNKREYVLPSLSPEVDKNPENIERRDLQHSEFAKKLTEKTKNLEEGFERLEKSPFMADISFEIADMERFSVINRFARFHSKGPVSGNPSESARLKPIPERYIAVAPMPINLPQGVQCISL
ncbi:unnamed protein product [Cochlearia groenlandica]